MKTEPKILADTSAWIASFQREGHDALKQKLDEALEKNVLAISGLVLCELLQGAKSETEYQKLAERFRALHYLPTPEGTWERAAKLSFALRRQGLTIPTTDVVIAQIALDNRCALLHCDHHFDLIARHSDLQVIAAV